ncbi:Binding-protein-dependent transport systems inner membrane component [Nostocoides japonicum T1-X7]|uniref:Binding-protein-dependent transport systems inner membrane component n=1 Tax=Nostocoides japonicum T1-X7 TaxID=1194083 RepID=A0A077M5P9_9MICO|nr:ABC transporter permease [Tetrasphaera japonica]CCH79375.1 Binding-protein-dependent transport systems inner membrane component [Tetrasphaera japonica T1-X7]
MANEPERTPDFSHEGSSQFTTGLAATEAVAEGDETPEGGAGKAPSIAGRTPWQLARMRLRRDKLTMFMLWVVAITVVVGILAPVLSKLGVLEPNVFHGELIDGASGGLPKGSWGGISWSHPLGVEPTTGRDVLSRLVLGVTFSLLIAVSATLLAVVIGTILGIVSGFAGGKVDFWISRLIDMTLSFPQTLMLLALSGGFIAILAKVIPGTNGPAAAYIILVLGLFGWPSFARIIRGQVLSLREREFIESAKSLGAKSGRLWFKELLPNLWAPILIYSTLIMPANVSAEAALSFLGVGVKNPTPTLGNILTNAVNYPSSDFIYFFASAMFIAIIVISFNLVGDGLRDALDPKADR